MIYNYKSRFIVYCLFSLFNTKYTICKIPQVLNIKINTNRTRWLLCPALYNAIHFRIKSQIANQIDKIINQASSPERLSIFVAISILFNN